MSNRIRVMRDLCHDYDNGCAGYQGPNPQIFAPIFGYVRQYVPRTRNYKNCYYKNVCQMMAGHLCRHGKIRIVGRWQYGLNSLLEYCLTDLILHRRLWFADQNSGRVLCNSLRHHLSAVPGRLWGQAVHGTGDRLSYLYIRAGLTGCNLYWHREWRRYQIQRPIFLSGGYVPGMCLFHEQYHLVCRTLPGQIRNYIGRHRNCPIQNTILLIHIVRSSRLGLFEFAWRTNLSYGTQQGGMECR